MIQGNSQNDILSAKKLEAWLAWLEKNTLYVPDTTDVFEDNTEADVEIPESIVEMLRFTIGLSGSASPGSMRQDEIKRCIDSINNNKAEVTSFFETLQSKPSTIIPLMQRLGRPLPLPLKNLIRAMEDVAEDKTPASDSLRKALMTYLELLKEQQNQLVSLMQDSVDVVVERSDTNPGDEAIDSFINEWVVEFEAQFVEVAKMDNYSKQFGKLINASVQVLKEQKIYRDNLRGN